MGDFEHFFSDFFGINERDVRDEIKYQGIEKWDSLNHLNFVSKLEEKYGIELDMDEITDMNSVGRIKDILRKHGVTL